MSNDNLKRFLEKVASDDALRTKLTSTPSSEAIVNAAKEAGFTITIEDVESSTATSELAGVLSDADLDVVVGAVGRCIHTAKDDPKNPPKTYFASCNLNTVGTAPACGGDGKHPAPTGGGEDDAPTTEGSDPGFF